MTDLMDTILVVRHTLGDMTVMPNTTVFDKRLSLRARGVLFLLMAATDETLVSTTDISKYATEGRDACRTALRELMTLGYVQQTKHAYTNAYGKPLWATETVVRDTPLPGEILPPRADYQGSENGGVSAASMNNLRQGKIDGKIPKRIKSEFKSLKSLKSLTEDADPCGLSGPIVVNTSTSSSNSSSVNTTYKLNLKKPNPEAVAARRPDVPRGWEAFALSEEGKYKRHPKSETHPSQSKKRKAKISKATQRREASQRELEATDPATSISRDFDDIPEDTRTTPENVPETRNGSETATGVPTHPLRTPSKPRKRPLGPAAGLALYFVTTATSPVVSEPPGRFNSGALGSNFSRWMKNEASQEHIRDMIDEYWTGGYRRNLTRPAWLDFLAGQEKIHAQCERRWQAAQFEANRDPDDAE